MAGKHYRRLVAGVCGLAVLTALVWYIWPARVTPAPTRPVALPTGGYVGSAACRNCHQSEHGAWHDSYHRTMTQAATDESVLGDFNNVRFAAKDLDVRLFKRDGQFMVELDVRNPAKA